LNEQVLYGWLSQDVCIRDDKLRTYIHTHVHTVHTRIPKSIVVREQG